eukprot:760145-Pelagomonas_calceolata.AAC.4
MGESCWLWRADADLRNAGLAAALRCRSPALWPYMTVMPPAAAAPLLSALPLPPPAAPPRCCRSSACIAAVRCAWM